MDREALRKEMISDITAIEGHPLFLSRRQKALLAAQKQFWMQDDGTNLDKVLALLKEK